MKIKTHNKYMTPYLVASCCLIVWYANRYFGPDQQLLTVLVSLGIQLINVKIATKISMRLMFPRKFFNKNFLETKEDGEIRIVADVEKLLKKHKDKKIHEILWLENDSLCEVLEGLVKDNVDDHFDYGVYLNAEKPNSFIYKINPKTEIARRFTKKVQEVFENKGSL